MLQFRHIAISAGLHLSVIALFVTGVVGTFKPVHVSQEPIPIELVDEIAEKTQNTDLGKSPAIRDAKKQEVNKKPEPKREVLEAKKEALLPTETVPEVTPVAKPKPKPRVKPDKNEEKKEKPTKAVSTKAAKAKPKPQKQRDFLSVLKDLDNSKDLAGQETKNSQTGRGGNNADQVTMSELDRVRRQIEQEWVFPRNTQGVGSYVVQIDIQMNPDRTVRSARITDRSKMRDESYRILAESALRAVMVFKHKPLLLPKDKYNSWRQITMGFDPEHML